MLSEIDRTSSTEYQSNKLLNLYNFYIVQQHTKCTVYYAFFDKSTKIGTQDIEALTTMLMVAIATVYKMAVKQVVLTTIRPLII